MKNSEKIKIIVDETVDLYPGFRKDEIVIVKIHLFLNGKEVRLTKEDFYEKITNKDNHFKTSQANPEDFQKVFNEYSGYKLIVITASSKLSGINNSANIAKRESTNKNITVIDSESLSIGLAILADKALDMIKDGRTYNDIVNKLEELKSKIRIFFLLTQLDYLVSSGRVNKMIGLLGSLVGMKPLLELKKGVLLGAGRMITSNDLSNLFQDFLDTKIVKTRRLYLLHNNLDTEFNKLKNNLGKHYGVESVNYLNILLGVYSGPECLAAGWIEE